MTNRITSSILLAVTLAIAATANAEVYKCKGADGRITLTEIPCPPTAQGETLKVRPNVVDSSEGRRNVERASIDRKLENIETINQQRQLHVDDLSGWRRRYEQRKLNRDEADRRRLSREWEQIKQAQDRVSEAKERARQ